MTNQLDILFVEIFHAYLNTAESRAAGVPAASDCALLAMDSDDDEKDPRICLTADWTGEWRSKQVNVIAVSRGTKPRSVTSPWLASVGARMADEQELMKFIATLPPAQRTGWQLEQVSPPQPARVIREEGAIIEAGIGVKIHITV